MATDYTAATMKISIDHPNGGTNTVEHKICLYNHGPTMWESRRFIISTHVSENANFKTNVYVNRNMAYWRQVCDQLGVYYDMHFKPSRSCALASRLPEVLNDPLIRQEYTCSTMGAILMCMIQANEAHLKRERNMS